MERAARVFRKAKQSRSLLTDDQTLAAVWPTAVGRAIANHTSHIRLVRKTLVVDVEDAMWQRQLRSLEKQIIERVKVLIPDLAVTEMEFRIGVPRREAQRATTARGVASGAPLFAGGPVDEADSIQDPGLKKVFEISRRKATA
jgi:predicted nucleic acid-binding Zn ribbon protein